MKKKIFVALLVLLTILSFSFALSACANNDPESGITSGADGKDGVDGADGRGIKNMEINSDGDLVITYTDDTTVNLGKVTGEKGEDGEKGESGKDGKEIDYILFNANNEVLFKFNDGSTINLGKLTPDGANGKDGRGIKDVKFNEAKELIITYTDGTTTNLGKINLDVSGKDGRGILDIKVSPDNELIITYTDGTTATVGKITINGGSNGADGEDGKDGRGIASVELNSENELIITCTDGTSVNLGKISGAGGGTDGKDGRGIAKIETNDKNELVITYTDNTSVNLGNIFGCSHEYSEWETGLEPTCTSIGYNIRTCNKCGDTDYKMLEAVGHNFDNGTEVTKLTCTQDGLTLYICNTCGTAKAEKTLCEGHNYDGETGICLVCGQLIVSEGLEYELNEDGASYSVKGIGTCTDTRIGIPATYENLPVTSIGNSAFLGAEFDFIYIPITITTIGEYTFRESHIKSVTIPESVTAIGRGAFYRCYYLEEVIILSNNLTEIPNHTFYYCRLLPELTLPESLTSIGNLAFYNCRALTEITLPASLTYIATGAFGGNSSLKTVRYLGDVSEWCSINFDNTTQLLRDADEFYIGNEIVKDLIIPNGVLSVNKYVFKGYKGLETVTFSDTVIAVGRAAFSDCNNLRTVTLSDSVTSIGANCFRDCTNLTSVSLNNNLTKIGYSAFFGCASLESITIPQSIDYIDRCAFENCDKLKSVVFEDKEGWSRVANNGNESITDSFTTEDMGDAVYISDRLKETYNYTDSDGTVHNVGYVWTKSNDFSKGLSYSLNSGGKSYTVYGIGTFTGENLVIPSTYNGLPVTNIRTVAFGNSAKIKSVFIPESITNIGNNSFYRCENLESIVVQAGNPVYHSAGNCLIETATKTLICGCKESIIPDDGSVTAIGLRAFAWCTGLNSITIPSNIEIIASSAFLRCYNLYKIINLSELNIVAGSSGFGGIGLYAVCVHNSEKEADYVLTTDENGYTFFADSLHCSLLSYSGSETELVLPETFNGLNYKINFKAFQNVGFITSIVIPDGVTHIDAYAFQGCTNLKNVVLSKNLEYLGNYSFEQCESLSEISLPKQMEYLGDGVFRYCSSLTEIILPDNIERVSSLFQGCTSLLKVSIPEGVRYIGHQAFYRCESLTEIQLPESLEHIYECAFYNCKNLHKINIPDSVISIGTEAFSGCVSLTEMVLPANITRLGNFVFNNCIGISDITLPENMTSIGTNILQGTAYYENPDNWDEGVLYLDNYLLTATKDITGEYVIKDGTVLISEGAFYGSENLEAVIIPDSVKRVLTAFTDCYNLKCVTIGKGVNYIDDYAFNDCKSLESVIFKDAEGWQRLLRYEDITENISAEDITDPSNAAKLLTEKYNGNYSYYWIKEEY